MLWHRNVMSKHVNSYIINIIIVGICIQRGIQPFQGGTPLPTSNPGSHAFSRLVT